MAQWNYTIYWGKQLREAIEDKDVQMVVKCLTACYRELLNKLSDEDKNCYEFDIEDQIEMLATFSESEEYIDEYLDTFYDLCDELRAWVIV